MAHDLHSVNTQGPVVQAPYWVQLERERDLFTASVSADGVNWAPIGQYTVPMASTVHVGLAVTSHADGTLGTAVFDNVTVTGLSTAAAASWSSGDIGRVAAPGSCVQNRGTFTVCGSGADIFGAADAFHFVWQSMGQDGSIVARVVSLTDTAGWAKAGVMIRETLAAESANACVAVTPAHGTVLQARTANHDSIVAAAARAALLNDGRKYHLALAELRPFTKGHPRDHWLNFQLARAYEGLGDTAAAAAHFLTAAGSDYPFRVGALYHVVRLDLCAARFERLGLLDTALELPGDIACHDEAGNQKRYYLSSILFTKALLLLKGADHHACESLLEEIYTFDKAIDERKFAHRWVLDALRGIAIEPGMVNIAYLRERLLGTHNQANISYTQELKSVPADASVLEIGAMDGVRYDPLRPHLVQRKWRATVVEPLPDMFELLRHNYAACPWVRCVNVAITEQSGALTMFRVDPEEAARRGAPDWVHGISSAFKGSTLKYLDDMVSEQTVTGMSFAEFVREFSIDRIDVLQIDTEGYDWKILRQIDLGKWNIGLVQIEIINLMPRDRLQVFSYFEAAGYEWSYDGMDVTAVRRRRIAPTLDGKV